ncbi:MAG: YggS family pyridoxal phosphate enzyme [Candidatus Poribacteria bacterium]|nr:MAG: YggS family pyridoxal phosphate enzyme [Candidatus Poribacteria bacterium]
MSELKERLREVQERIAEAAARAGRSPEEILLVAVTKTVPVERIQEAIAAGVEHFGENRVQEAEPKIEAIGHAVTWHFIGHLQSNKVRRAVAAFDWIQSVDGPKLLDRIERSARTLGRRPRLLIQVNVTGEPSKHGISPDRLKRLLDQAAPYEHVSIEGLMTIGPLTEDTETIRSAFRRLRELAEAVRQANYPNVQMRHLSMGMSNDYEIAVEEGATMVRLGTAIFGPRPT